ncbi:MAG: oligosaccharide flippase family protein [candidate division KSB1 bacterium]|nr:oligosaccharide flippase family protein [candidate division KSB1 bacterium]MDZ7368467.1 oligosaccharide flippase family protein [candidate division KSB1 bacterium]MDZ7406193.1 oligosaccharide flippase family protein [candidate division KSB1 bacterium]
MRLADYLKQSAWAGLDKSLPVIYGLGFLFAVVRVLPKEEFGLLGLFQAVFLFIEMIDQTLVQIPLVKFLSEGKENNWSIPASFLLSLLVLLLSAIACLVAAPLLAALMEAPKLAELLWLTPVLVAAFFLKNLAGQICIAHHWFRRLFVIDAAYFLGSLMLLLGWHVAFELSDTREVIWINICAAMAASLLSVILTWDVLKQTRWQFKLAQLKRFLAFGKYSFGTGIGNFFYAQIDVFLIGYFYDLTKVAIYRAGKIIFQFYNIVSQATQVVLLPLISQLDTAGKREELRALAEKTICFLFLILLPLHLLLLFGAELLLQVVYHGKYNDAVPILRVLVLGAFFLPWGAVGSNMQMGTGKSRVSFLFVILVAAFNLAANLLLLPRLGVIGAGLATTLTMLFGGTLHTLYMRRAVGLTLAGVWQRRLDALHFSRGWMAKLRTTMISTR